VIAEKQVKGHTVELEDEGISHSRIHDSSSRQVSSSVLALVRCGIESHVMSLGADHEGDLGFVGFSTDFSSCSSDTGQLMSDCQSCPGEEGEANSGQATHWTTCPYWPSLTPSRNMIIFSGFLLVFFIKISM
jgi:hypothetical protein